jgi:AcrR family transcriptional regulator
MPLERSTELSRKRADTRARLIEAAAELFGERGLHGATLADVAERAGMTTGAIYGNFRSKEDLFLSLFEGPLSGMHIEFRAGAPLKEQMRRLAEGVLASLPSAKARGVLFAEFQIYAQTHPQMQARVESGTAARVARLAGTWRMYFNEAEIGMPMEQFVVVIDALVDGLVAQWLLTPSIVTNETIVAAFERLS